MKKIEAERPSRNEERAPEFEVKIGAETGRSAIEQRFAKGLTVAFILTKNSDLWLMDKNHITALRENGIEWENVAATGRVSKAVGNGREGLNILYWNYPATSDRSKIVESLEGFFGIKI